ncbi:MAG: DUF3108 domain-containing protein [Pseudomonadota bacterium]
MRLGIWGGALAVLGLVALANSVQAASTDQRYDVYASGIKLGSLALKADNNGSQYAVSGRVSGGGLVGIFVTFDFSGTSQGSVRTDGRLQPIAYQARSDDGKTARTTRIAYRGGTPVSVSTDPPRNPRAYDAKPGAQGGTLDPISAVYAILGDAPVGQACGKTVEVFDGNRRSRLALGARQAAGDGRFVCAGTYTRVAGYSEKLLREKRTFPFQIQWLDRDGMMRVERFSTDTTFGRVNAIRR